MKILNALIAVEYNDYYGDIYTIQVAHNPDSTYPFEVSWSDDFDTFTLDGLRAKVDGILSETEPCPDEMHDEDHDDFDHYECDCEHVRNQDTHNAWRAALEACVQFEATGKVSENLSTALRDTLSGQVNAACRYPQARAVFSWDADREAIIGAVVRGLQQAGIDQDEVDQFSYEARTSPDVLAVARQWVTVS